MTASGTEAKVEHKSSGFMNSFNNLNNYTKVLLILYVVISITLFITVTAIVLLYQPKCNLSTQEPSLSFETIKNIPSGDFKALVSFLGYIKYAPDNENNRYEATYQEFEHKWTDFAPDNNEITIRSECASITFRLSMGSGYTRESEVYVILRTPNLGMYDCRGSTSWIANRVSRHFFCPHLKALKCYDQLDGDRKLVAEIYMAYLEIELDGISDIIMNGRYSTYADVCEKVRA